MYVKCFLALYFINVVFCTDAHAYLDPASGNALVTFLVATLGSALFFLKSIYYKLLGGTSSNNKPNQPSNQVYPILFSEGRSYWMTFQPIVEELISRKLHFKYVTIDVHDPALEISSPYMHSKLYSRSRFGFSKIEKLDGPIMLSTTPGIGYEGYPLGRPSGIKKLVHVFHALDDVSCYRLGSMDFYDSVLMVGPHEEKSIRLVEKARGLAPKELVAVGLPYLDALYHEKKEMERGGGWGKLREEAGSPTVLVAPSWGKKGCFTQYGTGFVLQLAKAGFTVLIRLHPHSYIHEPDAVAKWKMETSGYNSIIWDTNTFGNHAMSQADIMISDTSSVRFDFVFLYEKPVITLEISDENRSIFESRYMDETWADSVSSEIGVVISEKEIASIDSIVRDALSNFTGSKLRELRDVYVVNFGSSATHIVDYLVEQAEELTLTPKERAFKEELRVLKGDVNTLKKAVVRLLAEKKQAAVKK